MKCREVERRPQQIWKMIKLLQKARRTLHRKPRGCIPSGEQSRTEVQGSSPPFDHAPDEKLPTPDRPVIAIAGTVEADANRTALPGLSFGQHGGNVSAMMLDSATSSGGQFDGVPRGRVLRMPIVNYRQVVPVDRIHVHEITDGFLK